MGSKELKEMEEHTSFKDKSSSSDLSKKQDISFQAETENNSSKFNLLMVTHEMRRNSYVVHFKKKMVLVSGDVMQLLLPLRYRKVAE